MSALGRAGLFIPLVTAFLFVFVGVASAQPQTPGEEATDRLFLIVLIPALVIGVLVQLLIVFAVVRFRKRRGHTTLPGPPKIDDSKLETAWTVAPAIILVIVGLFTFQTLQVTDTIPDDPDVVVRAVGHQWFWEFFVDDLNGNVTRTIGGFTVKENQTVKLLIESVDVAHSLWIPDFQLKVDALPGRQNVYWFRALEAGDFVIKCAEFCGVNHYQMVATLHVDPA